MKFHTKRLVLSEIIAADIPAIHALHSLPETDRYNTLGIPAKYEETEQLIYQWIEMQNYIPQERYVFRITDAAENFVGLMGIKMGHENYKSAEVWYKLLPEFWNRGYATEALKGVLTFCFDILELHRITAGCAVENTASAKVLEKAGFQREGHHRKILPIRGQWVDNFSFAILEEDFVRKV